MCKFQNATMVLSSVKKSPVSIAFKPASVARRHASLKPTAVLNSTPSSQLGQPTAAVPDETKRPLGAGLGFSTVVTEVRVAAQQKPGSDSASEQNTAVDGAAGAHFFTANYRDEYHPSRPNSYEAFCDERINRQKLQEVKRELDRRQREQEQAVRRGAFTKKSWTLTLLIVISMPGKTRAGTTCKGLGGRKSTCY